MRKYLIFHEEMVNLNRESNPEILVFHHYDESVRSAQNLFLEMSSDNTTSVTRQLSDICRGGELSVVTLYLGFTPNLI